MLRAIIIDDEQQGINNIRLLVSKYIDDLKIVAETTDAFRGVELIEDYKPEIVFLDIKMPHLDGFGVLKKLQFRDFALIFTTAHEEYGLQAIKNDAFDYLLKPVDIDDLRTAIRKVRENLEKKKPVSDLSKLFAGPAADQQNKIQFNTKDRIEYVNKSDIIKLESDSNYTFVYWTGGQRLLVSKTIGDFETLLCGADSQFMRVHHSYIVNLARVTRYVRTSGMIITDEGYEVPISKNKLADFKRWLGSNTRI